MSKTLYDIAYDFEKILRQSNEYTNLKRVYTEVNADPVAKQLFNKFNNSQMELEKKQMEGQQILQQEVEAFQKIAAAVQRNKKISELMKADHQVNILILELNKIITKPIQEIYGNFK
ncbi:YlbF family regulator [Metabacillus fastidiosus]|uniref:YlbF family regulator n=1 Tax=Metabacillus fastidiosus TaxID=1458 RepID=UPI003D265040